MTPLRRSRANVVIAEDESTEVAQPFSVTALGVVTPVCCAPVATGPISDDDALAVALRLKALADPVWVKILSYLFGSSAGEETSGELAAVLALSESPSATT